MQNIIKYLRKVIPHNSPLRLWYTRLIQVFAYLRTKRHSLQNIKLIAVTGTDGKTTTVEMLAHMLNKHNIPYISSSSLEIKMNGDKLSESKRTTPSLSTILSLLQKARENKIQVVIIEVSSHALVQWRVLGIKFDAAILTNITHEHLNFHKTLKRYAQAKKLLFTKHLKSDGIAILNKEDEYGKKWLTELSCKTISYAQPDAHTSKNGTTFIYKESSYNLPMLGTYNASNAISATLALEATVDNITLQSALESLTDFKGIPGRMQLIQTPSNFNANVIIDFALTKKAMASTLSTARKLANNNKIIVVFGATGGQHDTSVRPGLSQSVSQQANIAIITDDEPYDGDPEEIRNDLERFIKEADAKNNKNTIIYNISDRRIAIHKALDLANEGDVIVVSGMGHYTTRTINGEEVPWSDSKVISEELQKL